MTMTTRRLLSILSFIEEAMNVTLQHASSANRAKIAKSQIRVVNWLESAREEVRKYHGDAKSLLPEPYFPKAPKTETTIINAALALTEDVYFLMRTRQMMFSKGMRSAWTRLLTALVDLLSHYDSDWKDEAGQTSGLALARRTWNATNRRRV